jgi:hypothetical protein
MSEPDFVFQTAEPMTQEQRMEWLRLHSGEANDEGATFHRASVHPEIEHLTLLESWKVRPEDQGEPRWGLVAAVKGALKP